MPDVRVPVSFEDEKTNPHSPLMERVDARTKKISLTAVEQVRRLESVESRLNKQDIEISCIKTDAAYTRGKIDAIAANADAQIAERASKERWSAVAKIVGAVLGVIGTVIAGWMAAR